jgi:nucleotide-binding universal stress UspA family protein
MKNILVTTDFSAASKNATEYAAALAQDFKAKLILVNVIVPPIVIEDISASAYMMTEAELLERDKELLKKEIEKISKKFDVKVDGFIREGSPTEIIRELAKAKHADLIVMGMKGKGKSNSIFGSTTNMVMRKSTIPVFVIPEKTIFKPIHRITFASEFDIKKEDYSIIEELAEKYNSSIQIVNVQKNEETMSVENAIGKMEANLSFVKLDHHFNTVENKSVEKGIHEFLETNPSDILAMVAHKHSFFKRVFGIVHTKEMSFQTRIPLLVFPIL